MKRVVLRRRAEADAETARDWYESEAELGEAFIVELRETLFSLRRMSERFPKVRPRVRRALMRRFPYAVYFVLRGDDVVVIAVLHTRRDPGTLDDRTDENNAG